MKTYGPLPLSTTPLAIVAQSYCSRIDVLELRSVANWPTTNLICQAPTTSDGQNVYAAGQTISFTAPGGFAPGQTVGYVSLPSGTTSGIQVEQ